MMETINDGRRHDREDEADEEVYRWCSEYTEEVGRRNWTKELCASWTQMVNGDELCSDHFLKRKGEDMTEGLRSHLDDDGVVGHDQ